MRAGVLCVAFTALIAAAPELFAQKTFVKIPAATPLAVQLGQHVPMKTGERLKCRLIYPVYAENRLAIPAGTILQGRVIRLVADRRRRIRARLSGDFTPFHIPIVNFNEVVFPGGAGLPIDTNNATNGAPVLHLSTPKSQHSHSFISQEIIAAKEYGNRTVALVTAPGRKDRLVQLLYKQLPYHPERIEAGTTWTVTLAQPLIMRPHPRSANAAPPVTPSAPRKKSPISPARPVRAEKGNNGWRLRAYLEQTLSSANEKKGDTFEARIAEPVFNADHVLVVPEGSILVGTITQAKPARSFGRAGKLRFDFRELRLPGAAAQHVQGTLAGVDASKSQSLQLDSEGGAQPTPKDRVIAPLVLTLLAGRALSDDGNPAGNAAIGSNGFGLVGRVIGIVAGSKALAAGIGFYAAGLSFSERWLVRGQNVVFRKNTRIEVTTVPSQKPLSAATPKSTGNRP